MAIPATAVRIGRQRAVRGEPARGFHRARVLLVGGDQPLCDHLANCLEAAGYKVSRAHSGLEGWCAYELEHPDLVVLDLDMPAISGFRLLRLLRQERDAVHSSASRRSPAPPLVMLAAEDLWGAHEAAHTGRPETFLQKPCAQRELVAAVARLLRGAERRAWARSA